MQQGFALTARRLLWTYWGVSEEALDKEFYIALQGDVIAKLRELLRGADKERLMVGREVQFLVARYSIRARLTNIDPPLATLLSPSTDFAARYYERPKEEQQNISAFLAETIRYPNSRLGEAFDSLVGIDAIKAGMLRELQFLLDPGRFGRWMQQYYPTEPPLLMQTLNSRYPLLVLEGEVGGGKTMLARSIGHTLAKLLNSALVLYVMNAQVRGGGHVGELTQNISRAFDEAERCYRQEQIPVMLLIDEADALAQARGSQQTHHEDDAGVNALIQRIDRLRGKPIGVIFATNRFQSLDSAILRRAAAVFHFQRPNFQARRQVFRSLLLPLGLSEHDCYRLAVKTNPDAIPGWISNDENGDMLHRYTYSDLTQRLIPYAIENAVEEQSPLQYRYLEKASEDIHPTPESADAMSDLVSYFDEPEEGQQALYASGIEERAAQQL